MNGSLRFYFRGYRWTRTLHRLLLGVALLSGAVNSDVYSLDRIPPPPPPIQALIDSASTGDTVFVSPGTYFENIDYLGKAIVVKSLEGPENTVIDGSYNGSTVSFCDCEDTLSVLDGFTVRHGTGTKHYNIPRGGGVDAYQSSCKLLTCIIEENRCGITPEEGYGGGVELNYGTLVMNDCIVRNNTATKFGGGLCLGAVEGYISNCLIMNNETTGYFSETSYRGGRGGGLYVSSGNEFIIQKNLFSCNTCTRPDGEYNETWAGALMCTKSVALIRNNLFIGNAAVYGGAVYVAGECNGTTLTRNLFLENSAGDYWESGAGGGIYANGGDADPAIQNNTFVRNGSYRGLENEPRAGSIGHYRSGGCVANNIVTETLSGFACNIKYAINHHNCYWDNADGDVYYPGEGAIFLDPCFINGGRYNFHLSPSSPCIDAGWDPGLGETKCGEEYDIGAFEFCGIPTAIPWYNMLHPVIAVSDSFFWEAGLEGSESRSDTLVIRNKGVRDLEYSVDTPSVDWLEVEGALEGVLRPNIIARIMLHYDNGGLTIGAYIDTMLIESNDPHRPLLKLPVSLSIYSHGTIRVPEVMPTIRSAVEVAADGDTVLVSPGTYAGEENREINFLGKAIVLKSGYPHTETVIDCGGLGRGLIFDSGETVDSRVEGFVIRNGYHESQGGGIYCYESSPVILGCRIEDCGAGAEGGGIYIRRGAPSLERCRVTGCSTENGGGIRLYLCTFNVLNCTIADNSAGNKGGGFFSYNSNLYISNSIIRGNTATSIDYYGDTPTITFTNIEGGWQGEGNIDLPAMFAGGGDYSLLEGSPCIDAGNPETPNIPWGGARRDMGALEFDKGWYLDGSGNFVRKPILLNRNPDQRHRSPEISYRVPANLIP